MSDFLNLDDITNCVSALISRNELWANKNVQAYFITNKTAGCFTKKSKSKHYKQVFNESYEEIIKKPQCAASITTKVFSTEYAGHGKDLANAILTELIGSYNPGDECLIIAAGGDGTSLEVQTALQKAAFSEPKKKEMIMNHITLLRLPLGTGNDGTDGHSVEEFIQLMSGPLHFTNSRAIKVYPEGKRTEEDIKRSGHNPKKYDSLDYDAPWYTFNVCSIGLDAYVVYMSNTIKKRFPGNIYKICVPLSGMVYDKDFPSGNAKYELYNDKGELFKKVETKITLTAIGPSGNRVYGGGQKVLPNENNVCLCPKVTLRRLIRDSGKFADGSFVGTDLADLYSADKIRVDYDEAILLNCDGEIHMLCKEDFPIVFEKTEPCIRIISSSNQA